MTELPKAVGLAGFALVPICCLGVPLLFAAGLSVTALALLAGVTVAAIARATAIGLLIAHARRSRRIRASSVSEA